jgi:hypothetical protein
MARERRSARQTTSAALALFLAASLASASARAHEGDTFVPPPTALTPPPPQEHVAPPTSGVTPWPWVLTGVGALTLGTGIWLVHKDDTDAAMPACTTSQVSRTTCPYSTATMWQGWALVAVGAELAIAGTAWGVYQIRHRPKKSVTVVAGLGSFGLAGTF